MAAYEGGLACKFHGNKQDMDKLAQFMQNSLNHFVKAGAHEMNMIDEWGFLEEYDVQNQQFDSECVSWDYVELNTLQALFTEIIHRFPDIQFEGNCSVALVMAGGYSVRAKWIHKEKNDLWWQISYYDPEEDNDDEDHNVEWSVDTDTTYYITEDYYQEIKNDTFIPVYLFNQVK